MVLQKVVIYYWLIFAEKEIDYTKKRGKLNYLFYQLLNAYQNDKVIVFSNLVGQFDGLEKAIKSEGITVFRIDGSNSKK